VGGLFIDINCFKLSQFKLPLSLARAYVNSRSLRIKKNTLILLIRFLQLHISLLQEHRSSSSNNLHHLLQNCYYCDQNNNKKKRNANKSKNKNKNTPLEGNNRRSCLRWQDQLNTVTHLISNRLVRDLVHWLAESEIFYDEQHQSILAQHFLHCCNEVFLHRHQDNSQSDPPKDINHSQVGPNSFDKKTETIPPPHIFLFRFLLLSAMLVLMTLIEGGIMRKIVAVIIILNRVKSKSKSKTG